MNRTDYILALILPVLAITGICEKVNAQTDSLMEVAAALPDGKEKVDIYGNLAFSIYLNAPDSALMLCDTLEAIGQRIGDEAYIARANYLRAVALVHKGLLGEALDAVNQSIVVFSKKQDLLRESIAQSMKGSIYTKMGLYDKATESLLTAAKQGELIGDTLNAAIAYHNLGNALFEHQDHLQAAKYYREALALNHAIDARDYIGLAHVALSNVLPEPDSIIHHLRLGEQYIESHGLRYQLLTVYHTYTRYFSLINDHENAIAYENKTLELAREFDDIQFQVAAHIGMGESFVHTDMPDSAIYHLEKGIALAEKYSYVSEIKDGYLDLADLYKARGNSTRAIGYYEKAYQLRDSLHALAITEEVQANTARFELERKERQIAEQELQIARQQNARNRLLIAGILLLALIAGGYQWHLNRQLKRKQAAELALTQQREAAQRLRELDELKTRFFTNISHELRTPLTLILSPVADLLEQARPTTLRDRLSIIKNNAQRLLGLVNEIMDLAKVEAGKLELQQSRVNLKTLINRAFYSYESMATMRRIDFQLENQLSNETVWLDRDKFEKILHNLLSNALKYTGAEGRIIMRAFQQNKQYIFELKDTGQGIHENDLPHIFDRFYQAKSGNTPLQGGTGVGLALAKELAELMGGKLEAESEPKQGSTFRLVLDLQAAQTPEAMEYPREPGNEAILENNITVGSQGPYSFAPITIAGEKPRLLVVEDNPEMGKYLLQILAENYQCVLATDGQEAIKQLKLARFDCITSDVMMPNMDGFELREQINQNPEWKQIPFLLLTARHLEKDKVRGFQLGIDDYITKPFSTKEALARIQNLIRNKLEREAYSAAEKDTPEEERLSVDKQLLKQAEEEVLRHLDDPQFSVDALAKAVGYSSKQLGRLLKKLTGMSTVNFILEVRLQKARDLLEKRLCATVMEAQLEVGINSTSYFTKKFTERFGKNPSEMIQ